METNPEAREQYGSNLLAGSRSQKSRPPRKNGERNPGAERLQPAVTSVASPRPDDQGGPLRER